MSELSFPIGKFRWPETISASDRSTWISEIAATPGWLRDAVAGLTDSQLDTPYRPGGWTVRQLVHHLADSHLHAYARVHFALTEDTPTIKPYDQDAWAALPDAATSPVELSLKLLEALHERWVALLTTLDDTAMRRTFRHPEYTRETTIEVVLAMYAWHGKHHVMHITALRERQGWDAAA